MNGQTYSEATLSMIIEVATQYIEARPLREGIIAKCHREIGLLVALAPPQQRAAVQLTPEEVRALALAFHRRRPERGVEAVSG